MGWQFLRVILSLYIPEEMERLSPKKPSFDKKIFVKAVARTGEQFRWPRGEIPYEIRSSVPNQNRITDAIYHWEEKTHIRFIPRQIIMPSIIQTMYHLSNTHHSLAKSRKRSFIVHRQSACRDWENSLLLFLTNVLLVM